MAKVILPDMGTEFPVDDGIAGSDEMLRASLQSIYPEIGNATIKRESKDGELVVTVVKQAGRKGALATADEATSAPGQDRSLQLRIDGIRLDGGTQLRAKMNQATIEQYAQDMEAGDAFPPVMVFQDADGILWLADGYHTVEAAKSVGHTAIWAKVRKGSKRDAILYAASANRTHGLPRTNADKRSAVEALLLDAEWRRLSDRELGRLAGVAHNFVGRVRNDLFPPPAGVSPRSARDGDDDEEDDSDEETVSNERIVTRGGTTYTYHPPAASAPVEEADDEAGEPEEEAALEDSGVFTEEVVEGTVAEGVEEELAVELPDEGAEVETVPDSTGEAAAPASASPPSASANKSPTSASSKPAPAAPAVQQPLPSAPTAPALPWSKTGATITLQIFPEREDGFRMTSLTVNAPGVTPVIEMATLVTVAALEKAPQIADALEVIEQRVTERFAATQPKTEVAAE